MRIEIEFPYYAEFKATRRRHPQREYLLARETFDLREIDPAAVRTVCIMDVAWETATRDAWKGIANAFRDFDGLDAHPADPSRPVALISDAAGTYWPTTSTSTGEPLAVKDWLGGIQADEARRTAVAEANPAPVPNSIQEMLAEPPSPDFHDVLGLRRILFDVSGRPRDGIACGDPRPRTAEEAAVKEFIVDTRERCRAAIAKALLNIAVHDGVLHRERGEPLYRVGRDNLGPSMEVVASHELGRSGHVFPDSQLFRVDRYEDAVALLRRKVDDVPDIPPIEVLSPPTEDPLAVMARDACRSLAFRFERLRKHARWGDLSMSLRARIDAMFPPGDTGHPTPDVFALADLAEACDDYLQPVYRAEPRNPVARSLANDLLDITKPLRERVAADLANGVVEPAAMRAASPGL